MNAATIAEAAVSKAMARPPVLSAAPEPTGQAPAQRLPVWEERARKMGFPPSQR